MASCLHRQACTCLDLQPALYAPCRQQRPLQQAGPSFFLSKFSSLLLHHGPQEQPQPGTESKSRTQAQCRVGCTATSNTIHAAPGPGAGFVHGLYYSPSALRCRQAAGTHVLSCPVSPCPLPSLFQPCSNPPSQNKGHHPQVPALLPTVLFTQLATKPCFTGTVAAGCKHRRIWAPQTDPE